MECPLCQRKLKDMPEEQGVPAFYCVKCHNYYFFKVEEDGALNKDTYILHPDPVVTELALRLFFGRNDIPKVDLGHRLPA